MKCKSKESEFRNSECFATYSSISFNAQLKHKNRRPFVRKARNIFVLHTPLLRSRSKASQGNTSHSTHNPTLSVYRHSNARMRKMADSDWPILYVFLLFFMKVLQNNTLFSIPNLSWSSKDREKRYDDILSVFFQRCKKIIPNFFKAYLVTEK